MNTDNIYRVVYMDFISDFCDLCAVIRNKLHIKWAKFSLCFKHYMHSKKEKLFSEIITAPKFMR